MFEWGPLQLRSSSGIAVRLCMVSFPQTLAQVQQVLLNPQIYPLKAFTTCSHCARSQMYPGPSGRALASTCSSKMEQAATFVCGLWVLMVTWVCACMGGRDMKRVWPRQATNQIIIQQITLNQAPFADCIETWSHDCSWLKALDRAGQNGVKVLFQCSTLDVFYIVDTLNKS